MMRFNDDLNIANIFMFVWKRGSVALRKHFPLFVFVKVSYRYITNGNINSGKVLARKENVKLLTERQRFL